MTEGAARGATLLQRLEAYSAPSYHLAWRTLPRVAEERAVHAVTHQNILISSLEAPGGAAVVSATAQFAAAVAAAQAEATAASLLVRELGELGARRPFSCADVA